MLFLLAFLAVTKGPGAWVGAQGWRQRTGGLSLERWVSLLALAVGLFWLAERIWA
jgi:hypothetical protein